MGGALKNVLAIGCGISDGLGFGHNARAALITRGKGCVCGKSRLRRAHACHSPAAGCVRMGGRAVCSERPEGTLPGTTLPLTNPPCLEHQG